MDIYLGRQAIYDANKKLVAYEILFRNSTINKFSADIDEEKATMKLISNCNTIGLDKLTNNKKAFINFPQGSLLKDVATLLPKDIVVIEILETVEPNRDVIMYLTELKEKGYKIALDDVIDNIKVNEFKDLIDIYKIDFINTTQETRKSLIKEIREVNPNAILVAEKVETEEEVIEAKENGYKLFQGFYFSKPTMIFGKDVPVRNLTCFNIMIELLNEDFNINTIEEIIKSDVGVSYKLLKFLNSAAFGFLQKIKSIKQAIALLGKNELKKWLALILISEMNSGQDEEITKDTILRSRFCELIEEKTHSNKKSEAFLVVLFSNLDLFINKDMSEIVSELPIEDEVKNALLGHDGELKDVLELALAYEHMEVEKIDFYVEKLGIDNAELADVYMESLEWVNKLLAIM